MNETRNYRRGDIYYSDIFFNIKKPSPLDRERGTARGPQIMRSIVWGSRCAVDEVYLRFLPPRDPSHCFRMTAEGASVLTYFGVISHKAKKHPFGCFVVGAC